MFDVGTDASYAIWQTIAHQLGGKHITSIRAVCRMSRKAVDDAVTGITVPGNTIESVLPSRERFPACKRYTFIETSEGLPQYVKAYCGPPSKQTSVLVCGEACWKQARLQDWLEASGNATWVGLVLRLCEDHQEDDLSVYLEGILDFECGARLSLLGLWCGREDNVVLATEIHWAQLVARTHGIQQLYAEFVHIDVAVLEDWTALNDLHLVFDEWAYGNIKCVSTMETLRTLCLEPDLRASIEYDTLYDLGPKIRILRLLGGAASRSFVETPDWEEFLPTLFRRLSNLECFETTQDARALVRVASAEPEQEEQGAFRDRDSLVMWKIWGLYVVVKRGSTALRGVLRSKDSVALLQDMSVK